MTDTESCVTKQSSLIGLLAKSTVSSVSQSITHHPWCLLRAVGDFFVTGSAAPASARVPNVIVRASDVGWLIGLRNANFPSAHLAVSLTV